MLAESLGFVIRSTYRALLREAQCLPHTYLSEFFRMRTVVYFRENIISRSISRRLIWKKVHKARKELRRLRRANDGEKAALTHVLDLAYGRKGKFHRELMKPYLTNPFDPLPPRIIPAVERSRPPSYSPELKSLLTSAHSRPKPISALALVQPPTLPPKANPTSEEARLLGPLSRRREVNIRWKYHTTQLARTYFPLELSMRDSKDTDFNSELRPTGLEKLKLLKEVEELARSPHDGTPLPRRQRGELSKLKNEELPCKVASETSSQVFYSRKPTRFIRRRYAELLSRIPILQPKADTKTACFTSRSSFAIDVSSQGSRVQPASEHDVEWLIKASQEQDTIRKK